MKIKRSIAIPEPLNKWLEKSAQKAGMSVSAFISHILMNYMDKKND